MATIFVVDDDPDVLKVTLALFIKHGYDAVGAVNGLDALQLVRKINPDIIVTDIIMPQMDGFRFLKELKDSPLTSGIPILIISGHGKMEDSFAAYGVDGFMTKPFSTKDLIQKVESILYGSEDSDEL